MPRHKDVVFVGSALRDLRAFPEDARRAAAIYVLHAVRKTTRKTEARDIELARARYQETGSRHD